jgi:phosphoribosyl 1,2-cyclic phosphate phosphodiesterase
MPKFSLEFLGSGTSVGVPVIACDCSVCTSSDPRNKRLRSSVWLKAFDDAQTLSTSVVIDTTPDFRTQMLRANVRRVDALIISHFHADHVVGIDDMRRFNSLQKTVIDCWCTVETEKSLRRSFGYVFSDEGIVRPGLPNLRVRNFSFGQPFQIGALELEPVRQDHHIIESAGFRITSRGSESLSYCLDVKRMPLESLERLRGTDTLILDMLREKPPHPTHMDLAEALATIAQVQPRRTYLGHIAHEVDHAELTNRLPSEIHLAYDGLIVSMK